MIRRWTVLHAAFLHPRTCSFRIKHLKLVCRPRTIPLPSATMRGTASVPLGLSIAMRGAASVPLGPSFLQCAVPPRYRSGPPLQCAVPPCYRSGPPLQCAVPPWHRSGHNARYRLGTTRAIYARYDRYRFGTARAALYYNARYRHPVCVLQSFNWIGVRNFQENTKTNRKPRNATLTL